MTPGLPRWPTMLAVAMVCLAGFYAVDAVARLPQELTASEEPEWIPVARVLVFVTGCCLALGWLRRSILRADHRSPRRTTAGSWRRRSQ